MAEDLILHATSVALDPAHGILITGASGSGKSSLALQLMAFGAKLISDDRTILRHKAGGIIAIAPANIKGRIEARGIGILHAATLKSAIPVLVIDLDRIETERLPPRRTVTHLGTAIPLLHRVESIHFPAAVLQHAKGGRWDT